ncbi:MAG: SHOCT domain-containing protein [Clostridiaceae bacterium]
MMLFPILLIVIVFLFLYHPDGKGCCYLNRNESKPSPLDILKIRFANGEIDEEEYLKKKDLLK